MVGFAGTTRDKAEEYPKAPSFRGYAFSADEENIARGARVGGSKGEMAA
jgi:hypothetical protein